MTAFPLDAVLQSLSEIAPLRLAEAWDNVGLLVGDRKVMVNRVMTCLTITPSVVTEVIERQAGLLVAHHPLPFKPLSRITSDSTTGQMLLDLISNGVAVYSAHTAFDSAAEGINAMWAEMLGLGKVKPLEPIADWPDENVGAGRYGLLADPMPLGEFINQVSLLVGATHCRLVESSAGKPKAGVRKVAIACGSGGGLLAAAKRHGCDTMVTGEATFHTCLDAQANGVNLVLVGHFQSERFAMVRLVDRLARELIGLDVFASEKDVDPLQDSF